MLALKPRQLKLYSLKAQGWIIEGIRHRRIKVENWRIGEASNPEPVINNKQLKQLKMGELFCKTTSNMN
eukprot:12667227-Heterocapsa_arctica.AAC.1